jgi:hypothetical protein
MLTAFITGAEATGSLNAHAISKDPFPKGSHKFQHNCASICREQTSSGRQQRNKNKQRKLQKKAALAFESLLQILLLVELGKGRPNRAALYMRFHVSRSQRKGGTGQTQVQ